MPDAAPPPDFTETTRLLFARPWRFVLGVAAMDGLPPAEGLEFAFAGRSNVGKSSLINALVGHSGMARTSNTPGRTRELNFFTPELATPGSGGLHLVDMPGYGYAKVSKTESDAWTRLVFTYLRGRPNLRRVYVLIDSRHGLKENDLAALDLLDKAAVSYQIVLTKTDKPRPAELASVEAAVRTGIARRPAAHPALLATSAETGAGIEALRSEIGALTLVTGA